MANQRWNTLNPHPTTNTASLETSSIYRAPPPLSPRDKTFIIYADEKQKKTGVERKFALTKKIETNPAGSEILQK